LNEKDKVSEGLRRNTGLTKLSAWVDTEEVELLRLSEEREGSMDRGLREPSELISEFEEELPKAEESPLSA
jgi:hypothetical protein